MDSENTDKTQPFSNDETNNAGSQNHVEPEAIDSGQTIEIRAQPSPQDVIFSGEEQKKSAHLKSRWAWMIGLSLLALFLVAAASALGGYFSGIDRRTSFESTQVAGKVEEQFQLGLQDLEAKRYDLARQRFEYVINLNPNYPGVTEKLALVLLAINTTATPTGIPTPTQSPTPDLRGAEELYSNAQVLLADGKWSEAIDTLLRLRKNEPDYQAIKVDSMLYIALRNRGVDRILKEGDLEGGTYDLALAEKFGPLDIEASNMRIWSDLYVTGASFWGLDWSQAVYYFGQLLAIAPNIRDNTNLTATERFRLASIKYGDFLAENGDFCGAEQQYQAAFNIGSDPAVEPTAEWAAQLCREGGKPDKPRKTPEPTQPGEVPTATPEAPQETPTPEPSQPYPPPTP